MSNSIPQTQLKSRTGIRDNLQRGSVGEFLKERIKTGADLAFVSAYFTVYAYGHLQEQLDQITHLRFLFGEPRFISSVDPDKTEKKSFIISMDGLSLANSLQQRQAAKLCADWIRRKVEIRSARRSDLLHGKMYHIANGNTDAAIMGSSNFTTRGLGLAGSGNNIELNLVVEDNRDLEDLRAWFDELWQDDTLTEDVKDEVLGYLERIYANNSPAFIYYKTLFHIFEQYLNQERQTDLDLFKTTLFDTQIWNKLFDFQKDGVKGVINKILTHNGCILADSVGLGKTFSALAVIKYFELRNERVLVLCPKKLSENWTVYQGNDQRNPFVIDRFRYDVLSHTDLSRQHGKSGNIDLATLNWSNYDLVVIDESHNFRNSAPGRMDESGNIPRPSRYQRLMQEILQKGIKTKVLLLSATPVNNDLRDLRNQLLLITADKNDAFVSSLGIADLRETMRIAQGRFTEWAKKPAKNRTTKELMNLLGGDFFKLLDSLTIARARHHVQEYYKHEMERLGGFPKRNKPQSEFPAIDAQSEFWTYDKVAKEIDGYKLSLFNPNGFVKPEFSQIYARKVGNFTQAQREGFLIGMMKVNFLKRLESSVHAFQLTMERTIQKIEQLEERLAGYQAIVTSNPTVDFEEVTIEDDDDDELTELLYIGKKYTYDTRHLDIDKWLEALAQDKRQLTNLRAQARLVTPERDAKLGILKRLIRTKVQTPTKNSRNELNRKVLVFTAFADTATYLYEELQGWAREELDIHIALVTGSGGNRTTYQPAGFQRSTEFSNILTNFSPRSKERSVRKDMPQSGEIDLLIATDCISEGQNLQDCDYLVNYDIHWNPVRIIQRFGRIDRIGSLNGTVQMVNFWPTSELEKYIDLKYRVEARMALVDIASTGDDDMLQLGAIEGMIDDDLKYRGRQLQRLKDEVLDLEDLDESVSLTDFSLDDFRRELMDFLESNRKELEEAPFGLYTVVPPLSAKASMGPGVVFCLRHKNGHAAAPTSNLNPLHPYFLVYVLRDGNVRFTFVNAKEMLSLFRDLCRGKTEPWQELCDMFDDETENGRAMQTYEELLMKAVHSTVEAYRKKVGGTILTDPLAKIPTRKERIEALDDFELVTWLVVKDGE